MSLGLFFLCQFGLAVHSQQPDGELLDWLHANGGWAHLSIEKVNDDGLRGVIATVDAKKGENLALLPHDLVLEVGSERHTSAENAAVLLGMQHKHAEWNRHLSPYWRSLPREPGSVLCRHVFTEEEADMLQSDALREEIQDDQVQLQEAYDGKVPWWRRMLGIVPRATLPKELGNDHNVTLQAFAHISCVLGAYAFSCERGSWPLHYRATCMLPVMDMINHKSSCESNVEIDQNRNGSYGCYAKRDIKAGEEVTQTYSPMLARMDHSLLQYGFVEPVDKPLLAGIDSATGLEHADDSLYGNHQHLRGPEEVERLQSILDGLGSTHDEDAALLNGARREGNTRLAAILQFRIQRRRALRQMVERLQKDQACSPPSPASAQEL